MTREPLHMPRWTAEDVQQLRELAAACTPTRIIARKLKRTPDAIWNRARIEGIALAGRKRE